MAQSAMSAANLPEPGLVMYGVVRNAASSNAHLISGTLTRTIAPTTGAPIAITTSLTNLGNQYSYLLRPPFESVVGNAAVLSRLAKLA